MNIQPTVQEAGQRYLQRTETRKQQMRSVKQNGIRAVETDDRIETRRQLLQVDNASTLEAVLEKNDLLHVNYLTKGITVSRSICRLRVQDTHQPWSGTGWMVSPTLLITNNHVLPSLADAKVGLAEFNYQEDINSTVGPIHTFRLSPEEFFFTSKELDFTLVAVKPTQVNGAGAALSEFGHLQLIEQSGKALLQESLSIIQHPGGDTKQIAMRNNQLVDIFDNFAHYLTDTKKGSSGSPVFNDSWQVVALHHAGVPKLDEKGRWLAKGGRLWKEEWGYDAVDWIANEGIRISSIFALLKAKSDWTAEEKLLLLEMGVSVS